MLKKTIWLILFLVLSSFAVAQEEIESDQCLECHDGSEKDAVVVTMELIDTSIHEGTDCIECHEDISELPHPEKLDEVNCGSCHEDEVAIYKQHGIPTLGAGPHVPECKDCHGTHKVLASDNGKSRTHPGNLADTCGTCHENPDVVKDHPFLPAHPVLTYWSSVHGTATYGDESRSVTCIDCHGTEKSAHQILPTGDTRSSINHFAISGTCGSCHEQENEDYTDGIHGQLMLRGKTNSPTCTNCHGEHRILASKNDSSNVNVANVAEGTCIPCHQSLSISEKYGLPPGQMADFIDPFHGLKSRTGGEAVATCSSCHESHKILDRTDPDSTIHPDNLQETCGKCHEDISAALANTEIHSLRKDHAEGWPWIFTLIYYVLITVTVTGMLIYIGLDMFRYLRRQAKGEQVRRMTRWDILQHSMLALTFIVLVFSGFALRYSDAAWAKLLFGTTGLISDRGDIHRVAGVLMILTSLMHLFYLAGKNGRTFLKQMFPGLKDLWQLWQMIRFNTGMAAERPKFGQFSYVEKFEYWALIWGTLIMSATGLILWFDNTIIRYFSVTFLDVIRVIHYYEAWLATLAILIWHSYAVIFNPGIYPMNLSWLTGNMTREQYEHEHPE